MAKALVLEFDGVGRDGYEAVNSGLGIDPSDPGTDWPDGIVSHVAGSTGTGWVVVEIWESQDAQARFMEERLGPALHGAGMPEPARVSWFDVVTDTRVS